MKLLFDQNISHRILAFVEDVFVDSSTVKKEGLINVNDIQIWEFAGKQGFTIVSQDSDFNSIHGLFGHPPKIIWVRTGNIGTIELAQLLINHKLDISSFVTNPDLGCLELFKMKSL